MKLIALGPSKFFREAWNSFDFVVVFCSLVELGQELNGGSGGGGLSVLRSLRLVSQGFFISYSSLLAVKNISS